MNKCKNCKHWMIHPEELTKVITDEILFPMDPDTYENMKMPFEVRRCYSPKLLEFERPIEKNQASVCDGSEYRAVLYTGSEFGCVNWENKSE